MATRQEYNFQYTPLEGRLPGSTFEQQTEDAINDIGNRVATAEYNSETAIENSETAMQTAQEAKNAADDAETTAENAQASADTANDAIAVINNTLTEIDWTQSFTDENGVLYQKIQGTDLGDVEEETLSETASRAGQTEIANAIRGLSLELLSNNVLPFSNVAKMKETDVPVGSMAVTKGYYAVNDGGAALYNIRAAVSGETYDNGSLILLDNGNVAELITDGTVCPEQFGAYCDGTHDDSTAIQKAIDSGYNVYMPKEYYISNTINISEDNTNIKCTGSITFDSDFVLFNITSKYNNIYIQSIEGTYQGWDSDVTPNGQFLFYGTAIKLNATNGSIDFNIIEVVYCWQVKYAFYLYTEGSGHGITYNKISFSYTRAMENIKFEIGGAVPSWINQNTFNGGRVSGNFGLVTRKGAGQTDPYNGNKFLGIGFELLYQNAIDCEFFRYNDFRDIRMNESLFGDYWVNFASDCNGNVIEGQYGVYFENLNDLNDSWVPNVYYPRQIIVGYSWGGTSKSVYFGKNQKVIKTEGGWVADAAEHPYSNLDITGDGTSTQYNLPQFGLVDGFNVNMDTTSGICIFNIPQNNSGGGYGYGEPCCHIVNIKVTGGGNNWYMRVGGSNKHVSSDTGYFRALYLNSTDWVVEKIADL